MKKLEDIPKEKVFEVPDGYFDRLPTIIQYKVAQQEKSRWKNHVLSVSLKFALPALAAAVVIFSIWFRNDKPMYPEEMLAAVSSEELVAYLHNSDISLEELLEFSQLEDEHPDSLHLHVISNFTESETEVNELEKELENEI